VHYGASIAVTLNDRLDFFGQTVNIAARVQGLAEADQVYITDDTFRAPGVAEILTAHQIARSDARLKGIREGVAVYRITLNEAS